MGAVTPLKRQSHKGSKIKTKRIKKSKQILVQPKKMYAVCNSDGAVWDVYHKAQDAYQRKWRGNSLIVRAVLVSSWKPKKRQTKKTS